MLLRAWQFILRFKILHVLFWLGTYLSLVHELHIAANGRPVYWTNSFFPVLADMLSVYTTLYVLLPWLFRRQKYVAFVLAAILSTIIICFACVYVKQTIEFHARGHNRFPVYLVALGVTLDAFVKTFVFSSIVIVYNWMVGTLKRRQIAHDQIKAELDFLKSQINPHFLLNTINNIYVLIDEDKQTASNMLIRFSELLRYQLYECNEGNNPIATEMEFIRNFIGIEQLRLGDSVAIETEGMDALPYFEIAPFVLLPFVENAFKYVSRRPGGDNRIRIRTAAEGGVFHFAVENTYDGHILPRTLPKPGGIGVSNVQRRLELLYPGKHSLALKKEGDTHTVNLSIHV